MYGIRFLEVGRRICSIIVAVIGSMWRVAVLSASGLLLPGCGASTPPSRGAAQSQDARENPKSGNGCPKDAKGQGVRIAQLRTEEDRQIMSVEPNPELGGEASLMWRGHLNRDEHEDLMLRFHEACGNAGECPWAIYAGCGVDQFVTVWGPDYSVQLDVAKAARPNGWAEVTRTVRVTTTKRDYASKRSLRFQRGSYREQRPSSKR